MSRGATSREVTLAWRLEIDEGACARGRALALFETAAADGALRASSPVALRRSVTDAFTLDTHEYGVWTFLCLLHDDDWANGDGDLLAGRLAHLASSTRGVVLAVHRDRLVGLWRIENGAAHAMAPLPDVLFGPCRDAAATRAALDAVEDAIATTPHRQELPPREVVPALVEAHLEGVVPTSDPLRYRFAAHPGVELVFVARKSEVVPELRRAGVEGARVVPTIGATAAEVITRLSGAEHDGLRVQLPLFLAEQGEPVDAAALVAALRVVRWEAPKIAGSARMRPQAIAACVQFLLGGVWDETARRSLVLFASHPSCPEEIVTRLAGHTSKSVRDACAARRARP